MSKYDLVDGLDAIKEILIDKEKEFVKIDPSDVYEKYNCYLSFEFCKTHLGYCIIINSNSLNKFEYYLGMEYEKDYIEYSLKVDDSMLLIYNYDCERIENIIDSLQD